MRRLVIGTAGHIDHGKSALVRALTGIEPDRLKEEQERGITIDLGFAHAQIGEIGVAFVDVPGHERFIRNMLAGATGIDAVLLVVAADESVMPQTREHLDICRLLDVRAGVIALTKIDVADAALRAVSREETRDLVNSSFLEHAPIVEVSARTGEGLEALRHELAALTHRIATRPSDGPARLPIDRVFTVKGFGTVVTGTLQSGSLRADDGLELLPAGRSTRVRGLQVHGNAVAEAQAGQRVAVNVGDLQVSDIARGDTLATPGLFEPVGRIDVRLDVLPSARPLRHGMRVRVHQGTSETMGRVALVQLLAEGHRTDASPSSVEPGGRAYARLRLESPIVVTRGDRFVARSYSPMTTIGGGLVLDPLPPRGSARTGASLARLTALDPGSDEAGSQQAATRACTALVGEYGRDGVTTPRLGARLGVSPLAIAAIVDSLVSAQQIVRVADTLMARAVFDRVARALLVLVSTHHDEFPDSEGVSREEARDRLRLAPRVLDALVEELSHDGRLAGRERLALPGRLATVSDADRAALAAVESIVREAGLKPLDPPEVVGRAGLPAAQVARSLNQLTRDKRLVWLGGLAFHRDTLDRVIAEVRAMKGPGGEVRLDVGAFKARYDLSRKFAIPLLEFLDRERVTRRVGDARIVL